MLQSWLIDSESQNTSCFDVFWFDCDQLKSSVVSNFHPSNLLSRTLWSTGGYSAALKLFTPLQILIDNLTGWRAHSRAFLHQDWWDWIVLIIRGVRKISCIYESRSQFYASRRYLSSSTEKPFYSKVYLFQSQNSDYARDIKPVYEINTARKHRGMRISDKVLT